MAAVLRSDHGVFWAAVCLRASLLVYGAFQDWYSPVKYTDIDYFVFTDAASFVSRGLSPYIRDTYRYTPVLAWIVYPTTWRGIWFAFGKVVFAAGDVVAGYLIVRILQTSQRMDRARALRFASIWLLNPMVAQISTRGSSEGLLCAVIISLLWAVLQRKHTLAGCLLGLAVHLKIYPFIYAASIVWWMDDRHTASRGRRPHRQAWFSPAIAFLNSARLTLAGSSLLTFTALNGAMYRAYGRPFLEHSYLYHLSRTDHRHNFSPYNSLLYKNSAPSEHFQLGLASLAFIPQLGFSCFLIPFALAKKDLPATMLAQTFSFVTFNKVCTSQYFLWYLVFLPFYLPSSSLLRRPMKGIAAGALWVLGQALWLQQGYQLEFLGSSTFFPGLWSASIAFFLTNIWILGVIIDDVACSHAISGPDPRSKTT